MKKERLEALSDGIFAIVITLLVIEIRVPEIHEHITNEVLLNSFKELSRSFWVTH